MARGVRLTLETRVPPVREPSVEVRISDTAGALRPIEQHGGRIPVESSVGHGTTFTIRCPQRRR